MEYNQAERDILLNSAKESIIYGLTNHSVQPVPLNNYPAHLIEPHACFVTIHKNNALRGCIGSLQATQPLIADVIANAYRAAFQDPRFHPIQASEIPNIRIDISVLSNPVPLTVTSEQDLLQKLKPGISGLILADATHRATFLPSVWEQLPNPQDFVIHLKNKAGWPNNYWHDSITVQTYTTELIS